MATSLSVFVDAIVLVLLLLAAVDGFRRGLLRSVTGLAGFVLGAMIGVWSAPTVGAAVTSALTDGPSGISVRIPLLRAAMVLLAVLGPALLGQWFGGRLGAALRSEVRREGSRALDSALGALALLLAAAVTSWALGGALRPAAPAPIAAALGRSALLTGIDELMPARLGTAVAGLRGAMAAGGMPDVFEAMTPEPIRSVAPPSEQIVASPALVALGRSVVRIDGAAPDCQSALEGSGWVLAPERVVTNAHVVAGTERRTVTDDLGTAHEADVVLFDPELDLAILRVPGLGAPPLALGGVARPGQEAAVAGYPMGGPYAVTPARVRGHLNARGRDIHGGIAVDRSVYSLRASVQPGHSGGPLVDSTGQVLGVVFARSLDDAATAYALTLAQVSPDLDLGRASNAAVPTGACVRR